MNTETVRNEVNYYLSEINRMSSEMVHLVERMKNAATSIENTNIVAAEQMRHAAADARCVMLGFGAVRSVLGAYCKCTDEQIANMNTQKQWDMTYPENDRNATVLFGNVYLNPSDIATPSSQDAILDAYATRDYDAILAAFLTGKLKIANGVTNEQFAASVAAWIDANPTPESVEGSIETDFATFAQRLLKIQSELVAARTLVTAMHKIHRETSPKAMTNRFSRALHEIQKCEIAVTVGLSDLKGE